MTFDLRHLCGVSVNDIGGSVKYGEAIALVDQIMAHDGSHLRSKISGFNRPASTAEVIAMIHAEAYVNAHLGEDATPIVLPRPWDPAPSAEDVTPEERADLAAQLKRRSAFREIE